MEKYSNIDLVHRVIRDLLSQNLREGSLLDQQSSNQLHTQSVIQQRSQT